MTKRDKIEEIVNNPVVRQNTSSSSNNNDYVGFKFSKKGDKRRIETFEGRRESDGRVFENRRVWRDDFVSPPTEEIESTVTIEEIDDDAGLNNNDRFPISDNKLIDNEKPSPSVKRQRTNDEGNYSVKKSGGGSRKNNQLVIKGEKHSQSNNSQNENSANNSSSSSGKTKEITEKASSNQVVEPNKKGGSQMIPITLGLGSGIVALITFGVKVFRR